MANKPLNINDNARRVAAQQAGQTVIEGSFESKTVEDIPINEAIDVSGVAYIFVYTTLQATASVSDTRDASGFAVLEDRTGADVLIDTARLVEVRGVRYIRFSQITTVVLTG